MDFYRDGGGMSGQSLINTVIYNLENHMMQSTSVISITNVHSGSFTHSF